MGGQGAPLSNECMDTRGTHSHTHAHTEGVADKMEGLSVKEEKQPVYEEMTYNESEILKAYENLMAQDRRWVWGGGGQRTSASAAWAGGVRLRAVQGGCARAAAHGLCCGQLQGVGGGAGAAGTGGAWVPGAARPSYTPLTHP